jgi:hypothetical protein
VSANKSVPIKCYFLSQQEKEANGISQLGQLNNELGIEAIMVLLGFMTNAIRWFHSSFFFGSKTTRRIKIYCLHCLNADSIKISLVMVYVYASVIKSNAYC